MPRILVFFLAFLPLVSCRRAEERFPPALSAPSPDKTSNLYSVTWLDHYFPAEVRHGTTVLATLTFRNSSNAVWNNFVRLSYTWAPVEPGATPQHSGHRVELSRPVAPGATVFLDHVEVEVPAAPGRYTLTFELVNELVAWFSDRGAPTLSFAVVVR